MEYINLSELKTHPQYKNAISLIGDDGMVFTYEELTIRIFTPVIAVLFIEQRYPELMDAYCRGYQLACEDMGRRYPTPQAVAKDLQIIYDNLKKKINISPVNVTAQNMAEIGSLAGMLGTIIEWVYMFPESLKNIVKPPENKPESHRLTHAQIALICAYEGREITKSNCNEIAGKHGWNSPTSGESIRQEFCIWQQPTNRHGNPDAVTSQKLKNKITLIEGIIPMLSKTHRQRAIDEVLILKSHLLNIYDEEL
ncbi:MAG: hypothetical protein EOM06_12715 [Sphingobacteriia bacterium]|nr:hypothetical protein [Sphingobacteriia bacterium]